jgi:rhamnogalacturonyl hydrolase YesR
MRYIKLPVDHSRASAQNEKPIRKCIERKELLNRAIRACDWISDVAQVTDTKLGYHGVIKGEYDTKSKEWKFYGPFWHTGQAVRLLLKAHAMTGKEKYLKHALMGGEYMIREQNKDKKDKRYYGFIHHKEAPMANTASQLEGFCALYDLYQTTHDNKWNESFHMAIDWVANNVYLKGEGLFHNGYSPIRDELTPVSTARPTNDDAMFLYAYKKFNNPLYLEIFKEVADRLLKDENPPGNWIIYPPCNPLAFDGKGSIHTRHAWWWGYPMLEAYDTFKDKKYLNAAIRAGDWYINNSNIDGGYYYHTTPEGHNHLSFDFSTSAVGCAVIMWCNLWKRLKHTKYVNAIERALGFLLRAQFNPDVKDPNVKGAFFEGYLPPDGTLEPGFYLRDIATVFPACAILTILETFDDQDIAYLEY